MQTAVSRVLTVTNMYPTAAQPAYGSFVASQVASLREIGVATDVLFVDGRSSRTNYLRGVRDIQRAITRGSYDVIHAHFGLTGCVARFQTKLPLVVSFCGDDVLGTPNGRAGRTLGSILMVGASHALEPFANAIIVKSEEMRRRLWLEASRARAVVLPNGVDLRLFRRIPVAEARHVLGLDRARRYVLFPSTPYERRKRLDLAQAAVAALGRRLGDVELLVVYHQPPSMMPAYYSAADAMLLTSDWEGSPNIVKEALACDLPVISVPTGDVAERIGDAPSCAICPRHPEALAAALERTLAMPRPTSLHERVADLDTVAVAHRLVDIYRRITGRARQRSNTRCAV